MSDKSLQMRCHSAIAIVSNDCPILDNVQLKRISQKKTNATVNTTCKLTLKKLLIAALLKSQKVTLKKGKNSFTDIDILSLVIIDLKAS